MITPLPSPPLRSSPSDFSAKGDAFMAALPQFVTEANLLESNTQASSLFGTSTTSNTIGTGSKTFTTQSGKAWTAGSSITIVSTASPTNLMFGTVTSYSSTSLVVNVTSTGGSGTLAAWSIQTSAPIPSIPDDPMDGGTTGGTSTAYTLTPTKPLTSYSSKETYWVTFHTTSGATPTLAISGLGTPPTLVYRNVSGSGYVNVAAGDIPANWTCRITLINSTQALVENLPIKDSLNTTRIDVASASTVDLTTNAPNTRHINITGTTTINGFTVANGQTYFVRFNASLTITNSGSLVTQTGANIVTQAGDTCIIRATAASTVEILSYVRAQLNTEATKGLPNYLCRAWVNFNGTGTVAIRASGNVSSITDNGTGDYTVNFTTAMPDANYCVAFGSGNATDTANKLSVSSLAAPTASTLRIAATNPANNGGVDITQVFVSIFR